MTKTRKTSSPHAHFGAMKRICVLGAQEDKHRDRGKKQTVLTSLQTAHTPSDSFSQHDHPGCTDHNLACLSATCSTKSCEQPFC